MYARECFRSCSHMVRIIHKGCFEKMVQCLIFKYLSNQVSDFQMFFSHWKLRPICKFWIQNYFCAILGGRMFTKQNGVLEQIHSYSCCLKVASKPQNLCKPPLTGPTRALIAPKWRQVGLVTQTNWIDVKTVFILLVNRHSKHRLELH